MNLKLTAISSDSYLFDGNLIRIDRDAKEVTCTCMDFSVHSICAHTRFAVSSLHKEGKLSKGYYDSFLSRKGDLPSFLTEVDSFTKSARTVLDMQLGEVLDFG